MMKKEKIETRNAPAAIGPYSQGIHADGLLFVSGQLPINPVTGEFPSNDITDQTKQSLENMKAILAEADCTMDQVVKITVFLSDINDFVAMNEVYSSYFSTPFPARSAFEVANLPKGAKVEIEAIARK